jgi:hypothetical protein
VSRQQIRIASLIFGLVALGALAQAPVVVADRTTCASSVDSYVAAGGFDVVFAMRAGTVDLGAPDYRGVGHGTTWTAGKDDGVCAGSDTGGPSYAATWMYATPGPHTIHIDEKSGPDCLATFTKPTKAIVCASGAKVTGARKAARDKCKLPRLIGKHIKKPYQSLFNKIWLDGCDDKAKIKRRSAGRKNRGKVIAQTPAPGKSKPTDFHATIVIGK